MSGNFLIKAMALALLPGVCDWGSDWGVWKAFAPYPCHIKNAPKV